MEGASKIFETRVATFCVYQKDVILVKFKNDIMVSLADAEELDLAILQNFPGDYFYIIDVLNVTSNMNPKALGYFSKSSAISDCTLGTAIVLNSLAMRLTSSAFITFYKPKFPTKIFKDFSSAEQWIENKKRKVG